jgi:tRNA threonylcarbamoyl adenosine modification protein YeaZ
MILALDTSSALTSVAVIDLHGDVLVEREHEDARRHAEVLGPLLAEVVAGIDIARVTAVACGVGPGPYTGLRVGIAAAVALGVAWQVPVHGLCSLDAIAAERQALDPGSVVTVAVDARRRELYWARYDATGRRVEGPRVTPAAEAPEAAVTAMPHARWVARRVQGLLGSGASPRVGAVPLDRHGDDTGATAAALAGAGLLAPAPLYLRRPDVTVAGG